MTDLDPAYKLKLVYSELDGFDDFGPDLLHSAEGPKHLVCKILAAQLVHKAGREVAIELETDNGDIDVLDLGESDQPATAIELETSCSPQKKRDKLDQYRSELIQEVITIDISEAPDDLDALEEWLRERVPGV